MTPGQIGRDSRRCMAFSTLSRWEYFLIIEELFHYISLLLGPCDELDTSITFHSSKAPLDVVPNQIMIIIVPEPVYAVDVLAVQVLFNLALHVGMVRPGRRLTMSVQRFPVPSCWDWRKCDTRPWTMGPWRFADRVH